VCACLHARACVTQNCDKGCACYFIL